MVILIDSICATHGPRQIGDPCLLKVASRQRTEEILKLLKIPPHDAGNWKTLWNNIAHRFARPRRLASRKLLIREIPDLCFVTGLRWLTRLFRRNWGLKREFRDPSIEPKNDCLVYLAGLATVILRYIRAGFLPYRNRLPVLDPGFHIFNVVLAHARPGDQLDFA